MDPLMREVWLLRDFHDKWLSFHALKSDKKGRPSAELTSSREKAAQALIDAHHAIEQFHRSQNKTEEVQAYRKAWNG